MSTTQQTSLLPSNTTNTSGIAQFVPISKDDRIKIGVVICLCGNLLISVALNIQKHAHNKIADSGKAYVKSSLWWFGLFLIAIGELGNFAAYGFAHATLIAPLGSSGVVFNVFIAVLCLREKLRLRDVFGIVFAVGGAWMLVYFTSPREKMIDGGEVIHYLRFPSFIVFVVIEVLFFVFLLYLRHCRDKSNVVIVLLQVALLGSPTVIAAKAVSSMLTITFQGENQLFYPIFYIMVIVLAVCAIAQVKFLNEAMASYTASAVIPINFILFSLSAILSGIVFYQEFWNYTPTEVTMTLLGALLSFGGVFLLSGGRDTKPDEEASGLLNDDEQVVTDYELDDVVGDPSPKDKVTDE